MCPALRALPFALALLPFLATSAAAQTFEAMGTRAQGMAGAFVGMADDASAVYWNPGGLARGAYFSLLLDGSMAEVAPDGDRTAASRSGYLLALGTPALGLSYYRQRLSTVRPVAGEGVDGTFLLDSLVTHHAGVTLVQTIVVEGLAVGATPKLVNAIAGSAIGTGRSAEELLEDMDVIGQSTSKFDVDAGVMFRGSAGSLGVTFRNLTEPSFENGSGGEVRLDRQIRAGASVILFPTWKLAADLDLTENMGPLGGPVRQLAVGAEGPVTRRLTARAGFHLNTVGDRGRTPGYAIGGSYAVAGAVLIDGHATTGSDETFRGWGIAGRIVF
jgi:hypothetical protein